MAKKRNTWTDAPPSLDLAFNWVKDVLSNQGRVADTLDRKATTLFSVATVILGVGVSARVLLSREFNLLTVIFGGLTIISYCFVIYIAYFAMRSRCYEILDNPIEIRKRYWDMNPPQFKMELLTHLENSYTTNQRNLSIKAKATNWLVVATIIEVICLLASLAFAFGA